MSIRPVDMQILMPRAMESSRAATNDNARPETQNQQFAQQVQKQVEQSQQTVIGANKSEGGTVDKDGRNGGGNAQQRRRRSTQAQSKPLEQDEPKKRQSTSMLDITL